MDASDLQNSYYDQQLYELCIQEERKLIDEYDQLLYKICLQEEKNHQCNNQGQTWVAISQVCKPQRNETDTVIDNTMMIRKWYLVRSTLSAKDADWINCLTIRLKTAKFRGYMAYVNEDGIQLKKSKATIFNGLLSIESDFQMNKKMKILDVDYWGHFIAKQGQDLELQTDDKSFDYKYFPLHDNQLHFEVKAVNCAKIALTVEPKSVQHRMYEIYLSYGLNGHSLIRSDWTFMTFVRKSHPRNDTGPLSAAEYRGFWIKYDWHGNISVGEKGNRTAFISWLDPDPMEKISYYGVSTLSTVGNWKFKSNYFIFSRCPEYLQSYENQVNNFCQTSTENFNWSYKIEDDCKYLHDDKFQNIIRKW